MRGRVSSVLPAFSAYLGRAGLCRTRETLDRVERALHLVFVEGDVVELACEVVVVRGQVEVSVAGQVEQDRPLPALLVCGPRDLEGSVNCVRRLGGGEDALAAGEDEGRGEDVVLQVRLGTDQVVAGGVGDQG